MDKIDLLLTKIKRTEEAMDSFREAMQQMMLTQKQILDRLEEIKPVQGTRWKRKELSEEWASLAAQMRPDLDVVETYRVFQEYWLGNRTKNAIKVNWDSTWKNWLKKAKEDKKVSATWRTNDHMATTKAAELGINDYGLTYESLRRKIEEKLRA